MFFFLPSLCIVVSNFFHLIEQTQMHSLLIARDISLCICTTTSLFIHLPMTSRLLPCPGYWKQCCDEHWCTSVSILVSLVCMASSGIAVSYGSSLSSFKGISTLFSIAAVLVCIPTNGARAFPSLHTLSSIYCL